MSPTRTAHYVVKKTGKLDDVVAVSAQAGVVVVRIDDECIRITPSAA